MKVVLGARPSGTTGIDAALSIRFDTNQVTRLPQLERVGNQGVRDLAVEVLGPNHAQHALALAAVSADTPLVTVVGGRLIARGDISPALLANEEEFRRQVFDRFSMEYEKAKQEKNQSSKNAALAEAVSLRRLDFIQLLVENGAEVKSVPLSDVLLEWNPHTGTESSIGRSNVSDTKPATFRFLTPNAGAPT